MQGVVSKKPKPILGDIQGGEDYWARVSGIWYLKTTPGRPCGRNEINIIEGQKKDSDNQAVICRGLSTGNDISLQEYCSRF